MKVILTSIVILCGVVLGVRTATAQVAEEPTASWFQYSGSVSTTADYYGSTTSTDSLGRPLWQPRQPGSIYRITLSTNITLFEQVQIPLFMSFTPSETNTLTPSVQPPTLSDFLQNPLNTISLSIRPGVDWAVIKLGSFVPVVSELAGSESQIFGYGAELSPSIFRASFYRGVFQRAAPSDTARGIAGAWKQSLMFMKLGIGVKDSTYIDLNVVKMIEDTTSLNNELRPVFRDIQRTVIPTTPPADPVYEESVVWKQLPARDGLLVSVNGKVSIEGGAYLFAEGAGSVETRDVKADPLDVSLNIPTSVQTLNTSTHGDFAALGGVGFDAGTWRIEGKLKYIGAGFVAFATPFQQSDYLDITIAPRFSLFDSKFFFAGTVGRRINNLSNNVGESLDQDLISLNATVLPIDDLSIGAGFNNFQIRNSVVNDTMRIQNVSRSAFLTSTGTIREGKAAHTITGTLSRDEFQDYNVVSSALTSNDTYSASLQYSYLFAKMPLTLSASATYLNNNAPQFGFTQAGGGIGAVYMFSNNKVIPRIDIQHLIITRLDGNVDNQSIVRIGTTWAVAKGLSVGGNASLNLFRYGAWRNNASFSEGFLRFSLSQSF
jgi:hypothetical protein